MMIDPIQDMILKQWERAGGVYAQAAREARKELEKEKED